MIQDCTCVQHFAHPPCLPHHPEDSLIALCLSFWRTLHTDRMNGLKIAHTTRRDGRGWTAGRKWGWGLRHASSLSVMPVKGGGRSGSPGWPSTSARHLESGFVVWRFSFIHNDPKRRRKKEPLTPQGGMNHVKGKEKAKSQSAVWKSPIILPSCPRNS